MTNKETCPVCGLHSSALYRGEGCPNGCDRPQPPTPTSIVKFIEDRVAEDERIAQDATDDGHNWLVEEETVSLWPDDRDPPDGFMSFPRKAHAHHAGHHSPARVLRQCAMIRAMLRRADEAGGLDLIVEGDRGVGPRTWPYIDDLMYRDIAAIWSDHPDYNQDWALVDADEES